MLLFHAEIPCVLTGGLRHTLQDRHQSPKGASINHSHQNQRQCGASHHHCSQYQDGRGASLPHQHEVSDTHCVQPSACHRHRTVPVPLRCCPPPASYGDQVRNGDCQEKYWAEENVNCAEDELQLYPSPRPRHRYENYAHHYYCAAACHADGEGSLWRRRESRDREFLRSLLGKAPLVEDCLA